MLFLKTFNRNNSLSSLCNLFGYRKADGRLHSLHLCSKIIWQAKKIYAVQDKCAATSYEYQTCKKLLSSPFIHIIYLKYFLQLRLNKLCDSQRLFLRFISQPSVIGRGRTVCPLSIVCLYRPTSRQAGHSSSRNRSLLRLIMRTIFIIT